MLNFYISLFLISQKAVTFFLYVILNWLPAATPCGLEVLNSERRGERSSLLGRYGLKYWSREQNLRRSSSTTQYTFKPHFTPTLSLVTLNSEMGVGGGWIPEAAHFYVNDTRKLLQRSIIWVSTMPLGWTWNSPFSSSILKLLSFSLRKAYGLNRFFMGLGGRVHGMFLYISLQPPVHYYFKIKVKK